MAETAAVVSIPAPGGTRPLSLTNTDVQIVAKAVAWPMREAVSRVVHSVQVGMPPGRVVVGNVADVEALALHN
eukprot:10878077-Lingulodinium_polyedra.AAC.1